jgi:hypothetical protein
VDLKRLMFKNLDNDNDTEAGHTHSGRVFRWVHLENLFKQKYGEADFYSGEEAYMTDKERSELAEAEEEAVEELRRNTPEPSGTMQATEVSNINPPVVSEMLSNQNILNHQSLQSIITSSSSSTQTGNLGNFMVDEMRLPIFRGDGFEDID